MAIKLTIDLDQKIFERAEAYAKQSGQSLASLVLTYLTHLSQLPPNHEDWLPSEFEGLFGIIDLPDGIDDKVLLRNLIHEKHGS